MTPEKPHDPAAREAYGVMWDSIPLIVGKPNIPRPMWMIERDCCLKRNNADKSPKWLGQAEHFRKFGSYVLAHPTAAKPFQWNPNAVRIVDEFFRWSYLAIAGGASSSKSDTLAAVSVLEFLLDPRNTKIIQSSTTLMEARGRIWGRTEYYWNEVIEFYKLHAFPGVPVPPPGELVSSKGMIRLCIEGRSDDTKGIVLAPGRESEVKEGIGRMKGFKAARVRFFPDEHSDLSHKLTEAAESNLFVNEDFKMASAFNPASHFDPAGVFSEPKGGWGSINVLDLDGWETTRGYCIRFDGECSPNVVAGYPKWVGLLTKEKLEEARERLGDNSPRFMEQYRGAWSETGASDGIYSESDIITYLGQKKVDVWTGAKTLFAGFDPGFAHGGDRCALVFVRAGEAICFEKTLIAAEVTELLFLDDNIDTSRDKKELVVQRLSAECKKRGLDPKNLAMDATGGGDVFATLMARDPYFAGSTFMKVAFSGSGSDMPSTDMPSKTGKERFVNLASEIWYSGRELLRGGQIRGLPAHIIRELTARLYEEVGKPAKIKIESKEDMKKRMNGRSPDAGDSFFLGLHCIRKRLGMKPPNRPGAFKKRSAPAGPYDFVKPSWGDKKPKTMNEPALGEVPQQKGGWGDKFEGSGVGFGFGD